MAATNSPAARSEKTQGQTKTEDINPPWERDVNSAAQLF